VIWGALVGGLLGTVVLTTLLRAAAEFGLTRIDIPFLLGTALTEDRIRAKGRIPHDFVFGLLFALAYGVVFAVVDEAGVLFGALLGLLHGLFKVGDQRARHLHERGLGGVAGASARRAQSRVIPRLDLRGSGYNWRSRWSG
jgi:hypothetical protein